VIYVLDTNIVSYSIKKQYGVNEKIKQILKNKTTIVIPPISYYETLRGLYAVKARRKIETFNRMCEEFVSEEMVREDWIEAAQVYALLVQTGHPMEDHDLLQAAFCLRNGYTLVTHNVRHFSHLTKLSLEDWAETL
jgi:tRNA(fMet)-specific endonuclease VapC